MIMMICRYKSRREEYLPHVEEERREVEKVAEALMI